MNKAILYFFTNVSGIYDDVLKWSMPKDAAELFKIVKNAKNLAKNEEKKHVQIALNIFFG